MSDLVLSLFPGAGLLDLAFHLEGFSVVRGPEWIFGQDVREFRPVPGRFDGIIGGDPCQSHSALANLVRAKGLEPSFPDLTPEFARVVEEAQPAWFLRENVPKAPDIKPAGYAVRSFLLCNSTLDSGDGWGNEQMRRRRWWFGVREGECPELRRWIPFALRELPETTQAVASDARAVAVAVGGSGKRKVTADDGIEPRRTLGEMLRLQGLPEDWMDRQPWTQSAKRKMVGNGVALPMGRALARAVRMARSQP